MTLFVRLRYMAKYTKSEIKSDYLVSSVNSELLYDKGGYRNEGKHLILYVKYMMYVQDVYNCNGFDILLPFSMHTLYVTYILRYYWLEGEHHRALVVLKLHIWGKSSYVHFGNNVPTLHVPSNLKYKSHLCGRLSALLQLHLHCQLNTRLQ